MSCNAQLAPGRSTLNPNPTLLQFWCPRAPVLCEGTAGWTLLLGRHPVSGGHWSWEGAAEVRERPLVQRLVHSEVLNRAPGKSVKIGPVLPAMSLSLGFSDPVCLGMPRSQVPPGVFPGYTCTPSPSHPVSSRNFTPHLVWNSSSPPLLWKLFRAWG